MLKKISLDYTIKSKFKLYLDYPKNLWNYTMNKFSYTKRIERQAVRKLIYLRKNSKFWENFFEISKIYF